MWIPISCTQDSTSGAWCLSLLVEILHQSVVYLESPFGDCGFLLELWSWCGEAVISTPTEDDVEDGVLQESRPLGWCAAGDHCHCPLWIQCGHLCFQYTVLSLTKVGFEPGNSCKFKPRNFSCTCLGHGNRFYSQLYFSSAKFCKDFSNWCACISPTAPISAVF